MTPQIIHHDRSHLEDRVGVDSADEVAVPVEATKQPRTAAVLETLEPDEAGASAARNRNADTQHSATSALEGADTGQPPRKSTRGGANHIKPDSQLQRRQTRKTTSPQARAARGK